MAETIGAIGGFFLIALIVWQVAKNGMARSNGDVDGVDSYYDHTRGGGD